MSQNLTPTEKALLLRFLENLQDQLGNAGCNDYRLPATPENRRFLTRVFEQQFSDPEEFKTQCQFLEEAKDYFVTTDFIVLGYLQSRVAEL